MSANARPYGMIPVARLDGLPFNHALRTMPIASAYGTAIFVGDVVKLHTDGTVQKDTGTSTLTPIGIAMGFQFTNPSTNQWLQQGYWPASTVAADAEVLVADDPNLLFRIQANGSITRAMVGSNFAIVQTAGAGPFPAKSKNALDASSVNTTNTLPLRLVDLWDAPGNAWGDAYTEVLVKWNVGHQYLNTTGLA